MNNSISLIRFKNTYFKNRSYKEKNFQLIIKSGFIRCSISWVLFWNRILEKNTNQWKTNEKAQGLYNAILWNSLYPFCWQSDIRYSFKQFLRHATHAIILLNLTKPEFNIIRFLITGRFVHLLISVSLMVFNRDK